MTYQHVLQKMQPYQYCINMDKLFNDFILMQSTMVNQLVHKEAGA